MKPNTSKPSCRLMALASLFFCLTSSFGPAAEPPKPTPRSGTLAAYARTLTLNRSVLGRGDGRVILTNDNITKLAPDGSITLGSVTQSGPKSSKTSAGTDTSERSRWQAAHHRQRQVIAGLEKRRSQLETEIDQIEDLGLTAKTMARLDRAKSKLRHLDKEIAAERSALARIVRDARRRGAEPGWFR